MASKRRPRLYPFKEPTRSYPYGGVLMNGVVTNNANTSHADVTWSTTVYKPNPFHGIDRWLFAFDEWGHRNAGWLWQRWPMRAFCSWWDRRIGA